jgi:dolichyl-phosphate-mannose-protein mannosyltransferase
VTDPDSRTRRLLVPLLLGAVLLLAIGIRVPAIGLTGHTGDVYVISTWAERMAAVGPPHFYEGGGSIYPALLYLYWPLGIAFDGEALGVAIKALAIPFDVAVGLLLFAALRSRVGGLAATGAATLYLLNPAVILAGPVWGQIDAAGTLLFLATLFAAADRRLTLAGGLGMLAGLVKPQFGFVLLPVVVLALVSRRDERRWRPLAGALAGAAAAYLLVAGPLLLDPVRHVGNIMGVTGIRPEASVYAPNPWALFFSYDAADQGLTWLGGVLLLAGLVAALLPLRRANDLRTLLFVGAFIVFAFYFLPTRVHERYLFPAMAVLAPLAAVSGRALVAYLVMAAGFALSLLYALADTTPFTLPAGWEEVLITRGVVVGLSIALIAAAVAFVALLRTRAAASLGTDVEPSEVSAPRASRW